MSNAFGTACTCNTGILPATYIPIFVSEEHPAFSIEETDRKRWNIKMELLRQEKEWII